MSIFLAGVLIANGQVSTFVFKYLDKYLNTFAPMEVFYTNRLVPGTFCRIKRGICLNDLQDCFSYNKFGAPIQYPLMQKIFNSYNVKMSIRLVVVLLLSFILVNLFQ